MPSFRLCFLHGDLRLITIDEQPITFERFRQCIVDNLPARQQLTDYQYVVSGKPPHQLNVNDENQFNEHRTLITDGSFVWMKPVARAVQ
jgi:hypothetical protein